MSNELEIKNRNELALFMLEESKEIPNLKQKWVSYESYLKERKQLITNFERLKESDDLAALSKIGVINLIINTIKEDN